jgi:hypothetical protein
MAIAAEAKRCLHALMNLAQRWLAELGMNQLRTAASSVGALSFFKSKTASFSERRW